LTPVHCCSSAVGNRLRRTDVPVTTMKCPSTFFSITGQYRLNISRREVSVGAIKRSKTTPMQGMRRRKHSSPKSLSAASTMRPSAAASFKMLLSDILGDITAICRTSCPSALSQAEIGVGAIATLAWQCQIPPTCSRKREHGTPELRRDNALVRADN
jgi:hypothetical protein